MAQGDCYTRFNSYLMTSECVETDDGNDENNGQCCWCSLPLAVYANLADNFFVISPLPVLIAVIGRVSGTFASLNRAPQSS